MEHRAEDTRTTRHANSAHCVAQGMEFVDADTRGRLRIAAAQGGADAQVMLARILCCRLCALELELRSKRIENNPEG